MVGRTEFIQWARHPREQQEAPGYDKTFARAATNRDSEQYATNRFTGCVNVFPCTLEHNPKHETIRGMLLRSRCRGFSCTVGPSAVLFPCHRQRWGRSGRSFLGITVPSNRDCGIWTPNVRRQKFQQAARGAQATHTPHSLQLTMVPKRVDDL